MTRQTPPDPKPKVALLSRSFSKSAGGAENYAVNLAQHLVAQFDIHVFCERSDIALPGITVHRMRRTIKRPRWIALWLFAWWSWRQTRRGYAIVHSHENTWHGNVHTVHVRPMRYNLLTAAQNPLAKALAYLKILTSVRLLAHLSLERLRFRNDGERLVVAVAPALGELIASTFGIPPAHLRLVPPGINLPDALPSTKPSLIDKADARAAFGLAQGAWVLLLLGHNFEKKGLAAVLRSLPLLPADVVLLVVGGNAAQVDTWRARCTQQGLGQRVVFAGTLPDSTRAFAAADCLVHATLDDMFPLVVLEAMAAKVPVVLSVAPYCLASPLVQAAQAASMVQDPHDEKEIAHAVNALRTDGLLREAQLAHATGFVHNHAWPQVAAQQALIYQQWLAAKA